METFTTVPIPITTRGIGIHINEYHQFCTKIFGNALPCSVHQMYRVALLQLDIRLQCCQRATILPFDPDIEIPYIQPHFKEFTELSIVQCNFNLVAKAISSVGNFTLNNIAYQPYIPQLMSDTRHQCTTTDVKNDDDFEPDTFSEKCRLICDPYLVNLSNLSAVVNLLASSHTPAHERLKFIQRNAIPGAQFSASGQLMNAIEIMPTNYDFTAASKDVLDFMALLTLIDQHDSLHPIVEPINFQSPGHLSILVSVHHPEAADFSLIFNKLVYADHSTIRAYQAMNEFDQFDGCVNLMNEYPITMKSKSDTREWKRWAIRCEYVSNALYNTDWPSALRSVMP